MGAFQIMRRLTFLSVILELAILSATSAFAQTYQAQIGGVVRDASGGAVPNTKVTATNIATGAQTSTESNSDGIYRLLALQPAQYRISATGPGFKTFEQGPLTLQVNDA